ncbi:MAG: hypothetical protein JWM05_3187 [Acidimicrobiales bacterium]|nr:hypothetical protein [Acidimicrobiales bacterium]
MAVHRSWTRALVVLALLTAGTVATLPTASALVPVTPVVLRPDAGTVATQSADCDGNPFALATPVGMAIDRGAGDDASQPVDVALSYSGSLVAGTDYQPLPSHLVIPAGTTSVRATSDRITQQAGTLTVTASGPAAPSGSASDSSRTITVPACEVLPPATLQVVVNQQFSVRLIDLFPGFNSSLARGVYEPQSGNLPAGTAFASVYVSGMPTTLGTFHGVVDGCIAASLCIQRLTLTMQVVTSAPPSSVSPGPTTVPGSGSTAPGATPVVSASQFTG